MAAVVTKRKRHLRDFAEEVRREYWLRGPYEEYAGGIRQPNTARLVAGYVLDRMSAERQGAVLGDLLRLESLDLLREPEEVLRAADSVGAILFDLACEVCWQILVTDLKLRVEDEIRAALAGPVRDL